MLITVTDMIKKNVKYAMLITVTDMVKKNVKYVMLITVTDMINNLTIQFCRNFPAKF